MNTQKTEYTVYHNTEIEQYIHERHISIQTEFIVLAHNLWEKNKPDTIPSWESIKEAICAKYDVLYTHVCKRLQGTATRKLGEADLEKGRRASENIDGQIEDTKEKIRIFGIDIDRMKLSYHWGMYWFLIILLGIIFLSDSYYNQKAFAAMGDNFLVTIVLSLGISAALWAIAHFLVKFIQHTARTVMQQRLLTAVCIGLCCPYIGAIAVVFGNKDKRTCRGYCCCPEIACALCMTSHIYVAVIIRLYYIDHIARNIAKGHAPSYLLGIRTNS